MKKTIKLTESDLEGLVEKILKESDNRYKGSFSYSDFIDTDLMQDVIERMNHLYCEGCGQEYKDALKEFNKGWEIDPRRTRRI
jgi:hypothetical protein